MPGTRPSESLEQVQVESRAQLRAWLESRSSQKESIWLVTFKRRHPSYLSYEDIVEEALCFGWVDSLSRGLDEERTMLLLAPRRPDSGWSRPNKERIARLEDAGLMREGGIAAVERAKADGSWTLLDGVENLEIPPDLAEALASRPPAAENFEAFPRSVKRGCLEQIVQAKRPETRLKRIIEIAEKAQQNVRPF